MWLAGWLVEAKEILADDGLGHWVDVEDQSLAHVQPPIGWLDGGLAATPFVNSVELCTSKNDYHHIYPVLVS